MIPVASAAEIMKSYDGELDVINEIKSKKIRPKSAYIGKWIRSASRKRFQDYQDKAPSSDIRNRPGTSKSPGKHTQCNFIL